jgi:hypothetical protein
MNPDTGQIVNLDAQQEFLEHCLPPASARELMLNMQTKFRQPIDVNNLSEDHRRELARTGRTAISRNTPCPCGSGKRFKRCCMTAAALCLLLLFAGCSTPIFSAAGDLGPVRYRVGVAYEAPTALLLDGDVTWDGFPFREDIPPDTQDLSKVVMPPGEE